MKAFIERLRKHDALILDTETTGLGQRAEILQIGMVTLDGEALFHSYVRPVKVKRWDEARRVHGISWSDVQDAPTMGELGQALEPLMQGRLTAVYNADFDKRMLWQSVRADSADGRFVWLRQQEWQCVMKAYAAYWGQRSRYGGFRWQSLSNACRQQGVRVAGAHDALADAKLTAALIRSIENKVGRP